MATVEQFSTYVASLASQVSARQHLMLSALWGVARAAANADVVIPQAIPWRNSLRLSWGDANERLVVWIEPSGEVVWEVTRRLQGPLRALHTTGEGLPVDEVRAIIRRHCARRGRVSGDRTQGE